MNLSKSARCHIRMNSRWAYLSAVCMGISVFIRTVYYFGLVNLRDLGGFALATEVILPMIIAAGYLIMIKGLQLNSPTLFGSLIGVYALNYLLLMRIDATGIIGGVLLVVTAGVFIATGLGFIPIRMPVVAASAVLVLFRFFIVDLTGYILPLSEFRPVMYLPEASNLFGFLAVALMAPALQLTRLRVGGEESEESAPDEENTFVPDGELSIADEEPAPEDAPVSEELFEWENSAPEDEIGETENTDQADSF